MRWSFADHFGVKPLYVSVDSVFCFASEIKALSPFLVGEVEPDIGSLALYPSFVWAPGGPLICGSVS